MYIYWKRRISKKNHPPRQPTWYEVDYYAYLRESSRDKETKAYRKKEIYLGCLKKVGKKFSRNIRVYFALEVEERLKKEGFSDEKIKEVLKMVRERIHIPREVFLEELRRRQEFIRRTS